MSDEFGQTLLRELIRALPAALDDDALEQLATRLGPHLHGGPTDGTRLLNTSEAASRAHVQVETVRRAIRAGELKVAARIGRSPRLSADAVDRWLAGTTEAASPSRRAKPRRSRPSELRDYSLTAAFKATT